MRNGRAPRPRSVESPQPGGEGPSGAPKKKVWSQNMRSLSRRSRAASKEAVKAARQVKKSKSAPVPGEEETLPSYMRPTRNSVMRQRSYKGKTEFPQKKYKWMERMKTMNAIRGKGKGKGKRKKVLRMSSYKSLRQGGSARSTHRISSIKEMKKLMSKRSRDLDEKKSGTLPNICELAEHELSDDKEDGTKQGGPESIGKAQEGGSFLKRSNVIRERDIDFEFGADDAANIDSGDTSHMNPPMDSLDSNTDPVSKEKIGEDLSKAQKSEARSEYPQMKDRAVLLDGGDVGNRPQPQSTPAGGGGIIPRKGEEVKKDYSKAQKSEIRSDHPQIKDRAVLLDGGDVGNRPHPQSTPAGGGGIIPRKGDEVKEVAEDTLKDVTAGDNPQLLRGTSSEEVVHPVATRADSTGIHHQRMASELRKSAIERATQQIEMETPISPQVESALSGGNTRQDTSTVLKEKPADPISTMSSNSLHRRPTAPHSSGELVGEPSKAPAKVPETSLSMESTETVVVRGQRTRDIALPFVHPAGDGGSIKEAPKDRSFWWELGAGFIAGIFTAVWLALARGCEECIEEPEEDVEVAPLLDVPEPGVPEAQPASTITANRDLQEEWLWHNA